jgi:hypothetical protein
MKFSKPTREKALVACGRCCCVCHNFRGTNIICHHIVQPKDGGDNSSDNCIPLCLNCHGDVKGYDSTHPVGTPFTTSELKQHREAWYEKVRSTQQAEPNEAYVRLDRKLYARIRRILPAYWAHDFLGAMPLGSIFELRQMDPLLRFRKCCRDPAFEFMNADLESRRSGLREALDCLHTVLCTHHTHDGNGRMVAHWRAWQNLPPMEFQRRQAVAIHEIERCAEAAYEAYGDFVRTARRRLLV